MKREEVLFYLTGTKIYLYIIDKNKEVIEEVDTSLFFEFGEISNTEKCREFITEFFSRNNIYTTLLKPDIYVLYNDVCNSDMEQLYKDSFINISYNELKFIGLLSLLKKFKNYENIVVYDKNYYTVMATQEKVKSLDNLDFNPIFIGEFQSQKLHFSDEDVIWNSLKTHFTNQ